MLLRQLCLFVHIIFLCGFSGFDLSEQILGSGSIIANWLLNEPRPIVGIIEDFSITHQISKKIANDTRYDHFTNIIPISYEKTVLLIGQAPTQSLKSQAYDYAISLPNVKQIFNQIIISPPTDPWRRIQDMTLRLIVRAKLIVTSNLRHCHFQVHTENGEVFILGKARVQEAATAVSVIQKTSGVTQVTRLIAITD